MGGEMICVDDSRDAFTDLCRTIKIIGNKERNV